MCEQIICYYCGESVNHETRENNSHWHELMCSFTSNFIRKVETIEKIQKYYFLGFTDQVDY